MNDPAASGDAASSSMLERGGGATGLGSSAANQVSGRGSREREASGLPRGGDDRAAYDSTADAAADGVARLSRGEAADGSATQLSADRRELLPIDAAGGSSAGTVLGGGRSSTVGGLDVSQPGVEAADIPAAGLRRVSTDHPHQAVGMQGSTVSTRHLDVAGTMGPLHGTPTWS